MYSEKTKSLSADVASGVVTEIRLLVVMVLQKVLGVVMMRGYRIRYAGSGLSRGV